MSRGTPFCYSHYYLELLRHGPMLAHEFGNVAPSVLAERIHRINVTLPGNWHIEGRWVHAPGRMGLRMKEKLYELLKD